MVHIDEPDAPAARPCGRVLGTEDATPLEFWVAVAEGSVLQLDDVVALERALPEGELLRIYGVVTQVRARHEGAHFDSDVFLIEEGVLPAEVSESAQVLATRFEPEVFVPPLPGTPVRRAVGAERPRQFFGRMERRWPAVADDEPLYLNLNFATSRRMNIRIGAPRARITRPSCSTPRSGCSGPEAVTQRPWSSTSGRGPALAGPVNTGWTIGRRPAPASACPSVRSRAWPSSPLPRSADAGAGRDEP